MSEVTSTFHSHLEFLQSDNILSALGAWVIILSKHADKKIETLANLGDKKTETLANQGDKKIETLAKLGDKKTETS